jgi:hypothetical protein
MKHLIHFIGEHKFKMILFFPLFYLFVGIYFRIILDAPSLRSIDPDYVYFMTGLNMSEGVIKVIHIDHPGTPLQFLVAIVFRLTHWLRGSATGYAEDVLRNPDLYLSVVNIAINIILAVALYAAGRYVAKKTGSVIYGMLVQTIPLISVILYEIIGRISPEQIIPLPIIALTAFLINHIAGKKKDFTTADLFILSLIIGLGLSIKLTMIPLLVIPLIIVKNWKSKILVTILSVVFFLIISIPVTLQIERFWNWTKDLFLHSGQYGSGEKNIIDLALFRENLGQMLRLQIHFSVLYLLMILIVLFSLIRFRKNRDSNVYRKTVIASAILLTVLFHAVMSGKHYAPRYFMPALMFGPLLIFLFVEIIKEFRPSKVLSSVLMIALSVFLLLTFTRQISVINYTSEAFESQIKARKMTRNISETFDKESIKVIVSQDYGCPFVEYALHFATVWSAQSLKPHYLEILAGLYPNTYQYTTWDGRFIHWGEPFDPEKIINQKISAYVYFEKNTEDLYNRTINKMLGNSTGFTVDKKMLFENPVNGEVIFQLFFSKPALP